MLGVLLFVFRIVEDIIQINKHKIFRKSFRTSLTNAWKTAGALVSPKGMTRYSKGPSGV